jgi:hypothetical protein
MRRGELKRPHMFSQGTDDYFIWPVEIGSGNACTLNIEDEKCIGLLILGFRLLRSGCYDSVWSTLLVPVGAIEDKIEDCNYKDPY